MFKHIAGALLASVAASQSQRIFGSENIERHIQKQKSNPLGKRSRGPATKPKRKRNMLVVSKRVRRKHRRAAK